MKPREKVPMKIPAPTIVELVQTAIARTAWSCKERVIDPARHGWLFGGAQN